MGRPNLLAAAVLVREFDSEFRIDQPPLRLMPAVTLLLAHIARLRRGDALGRRDFGGSVSKVRAAFLLGALFGAGEIAYVILWIVVPRDEAPADAAPGQS